MALFRKKKSITTDTMVSQYFNDMYDGGTTTADLLGGLKQSKYLIEVDVADRPTFGDAELKSLDLDLYVQSITIGENTTKYPEIASYIFKDNISLTEGFQSRVDEDILCFSTALNGNTFSEDSFDGSQNSGGDAWEYSNIKRTLFRESVPYCTVNQAYKSGYKSEQWYSRRDGHSKAEIRRDFGVEAQDIGGNLSGVADETKVIELSTTLSSKGIGGEFKRRKCLPNEAHAGIGHEIWMNKRHTQWGRTDISTTEGYGTEATPANTIFESIQGAEEFSRWDADNESTVLYGVGQARFNTDNYLTGAQSLELFTFWTGDNTNKELVNYGRAWVPGNGRAIQTGPQDRQEVMLVKTNIPYPSKSATPPSAAADGAIRSASIDVSVNRFELSSHGLVAGTAIQINGSTNATGFTDGLTYYVSSTSLDTDSFRITTNTAGGGVAITFGGTDDNEVEIKLVDVDNYDDAKHCSTIEMDINIKEMAHGFNYRAVAGVDHHGADGTKYDSAATESLWTLRRGLHIVFGTTPPKKEESLYDYVARMANLDKVSGRTPYHVNKLGVAGLASDGDDPDETLWSVRGSGYGQEETGQTTYLDGKSENDTQLKRAYFAGVSIMNIRFAGTQGMQVIPWNGTLGKDSTNWKHLKEGLYATDHDTDNATMHDNTEWGNEKIQDLILFEGLDVDASDSSTFKHGALGDKQSIPLTDTWTKFTFACSPTDSHNFVWDADGTNSGTTTATAKSAHHSFGRLYLSSPSDGELVNPMGGSSTNKAYIDLMLMGNQGNSVSYDEEDEPTAGGALKPGGTYEITTVDSTASNFTGSGASANTVGTVFTATDVGHSGDGRVRNVEKSPRNWPKHMSIWVTNYKSDRSDATGYKCDQALTAGTDAKTVVLIDSLKFKDFNYDITNSSQTDEMTISSPLKLEYGQSLLRPTKDEDSTMTHLNSRYTSTPAILSFGLSDRKYFSVDQKNDGSANAPVVGDLHKTWTTQPYGFWLNDFTADNLTALGDIPDSNIKAGFSMAAYDDGAGTIKPIKLGAQLTQHGYDHTEFGENGHAGSTVPHNLQPNWEDLYHNDTGTRGFETTWLNTNMIVKSNTVDLEGFPAKEFVIESYGYSGGGTHMANASMPIRKGDKIRLVKRGLNSSPTSAIGTGAAPVEFTVATVRGGENADNDITIDVSETVGGSNNDYDGYFVAINTPGLCRNFSQKGGFLAYINDLHHCVTKRENIAASTRILEIINSGRHQCVIKVDNTSIFSGSNDNEFIAYLYNETPTFALRNTMPDTIASNSANCKTGLKVIGIDSALKEVTLDWSEGKDNAGTEILNYDNLHRLYISPYKYWLYVAINLTDSDDKAVSARRYGNVNLMTNNWTDSNSVNRSWTGEALHGTYTNDYVDTPFTNRSGLGTTFNEYLFNDTTTGGVNGAYLNKWKLDREKDHSNINCDTDFGFGGFDEETLTGGHTGATVAIDSQYNRIKMPGVVSGADIEEGDTLNFLVDYKEVGISHKTTIRSRNHSSYPPYLYSIFEDELPTQPKLNVAPFKDDPLLTEFTWDASDGDLWYGILHIDSKSIDSQYHNAFFHLPLNEEGLDGAIVTLAGNSLYYNNTDVDASSKTALFSYSGAKIDSEGLAGNCVRFDGDNDVITYGPPTTGNLFSNITNEASILLHVVPDNGISGSTNNIFKGMPFHIFYNATAGKVVARCYTDDDDGDGTENYVELSSPDIITDGQTPTCIAVTIDPDLKSANCKLFINGALVDQSGLISSSAPGAAGNNWHNSNGTPKPAFTTDQGFTSATAAISFAGSIAYGETITIISTDGTSVTYTARAANDYANNEFDVDNGFDDKATALKGAIEHASGHNGKITVSQGGLGNVTLTLTQADEGQAGNTTITENLGNTTKSDFTGGDAATATIGTATNSFAGRIEEVVIYNKCIYPVVPSVAKFILDKPLKEIQNGTAISNNARLFVKDYHNIRGSSVSEVAASSPVSFRKAAFRLVD